MLFYILIKRLFFILFCQILAIISMFLYQQLCDQKIKHFDILLIILKYKKALKKTFLLIKIMV